MSGVLAGGGLGLVEQVAVGERRGLELGVGLAEPEAFHGFAGAAVGARAVRDLGLLLDPPVREGRILADDANQFGASLEEAARAVARIGRDTEIEGLAPPPIEDVGLTDAHVGERQHGVGAGARAAVHGAHPQHATLLVGTQPDYRVPALESEAVAGEVASILSLLRNPVQ